LRADTGAGVSVRGRISLTVVDAAWLAARGRDLAAVLAPPEPVVRDRADGDNIICTNGLFPVAQALAWAGIQDQAASLGVTSPSYLTPLYGAVGDGTGTPAASDTSLFAELARQVVGAGAAAPATPSIDALTTWLFFFPSPATAWSVTEAGVFVNATAAAGSGTLFDHYAFSPALAVSTSDSVILQMSLSVAGS
jgi:hypothetical protein